MLFSRREFLFLSAGALISWAPKPSKIMTVKGAISAEALGRSLIHEHFLVDFIGADKISSSHWDRTTVVNKVLPLLQEAKSAGVQSIFDCTPAFLGRDPLLLSELSEKSGLHIITNTGYYGAVQNKYLPPWAFTESAEQLAARWIAEFEHGIEGTSVKPGFIKISVAAETPISPLHQKLVRAAALTHLKTGLTICSHTGPAAPALEEIEILSREGVGPSAFVWVHAQNETDKNFHAQAATRGAWVSLDGLGWGEYDNYTDSLVRLKERKLLHRVLISHDAGWYKPEEPEGKINGYTAIFTELLPRLMKAGFTDKDIDQLLTRNPAEAMGVRVRKG